MGVNLTFTVREKRRLEIQKIVGDMGGKKSYRQTETNT